MSVEDDDDDDYYDANLSFFHLYFDLALLVFETFLFYF